MRGGALVTAVLLVCTIGVLLVLEYAASIDRLSSEALNAIGGGSGGFLLGWAIAEWRTRREFTADRAHDATLVTRAPLSVRSWFESLEVAEWR